DHAVAAGAGCGQRLAVGRPVAPERPAGPVLADLRRRQPFEGAVVDLDEVGLPLGVGEAGEACGLEGASARRGEHEREPTAFQTVFQRARGCAAALGERDVRARRVLPGRAPLGLPMTGEDDPHASAYLLASASTASTWRLTGAGPARSST